MIEARKIAVSVKRSDGPRAKSGRARVTVWHASGSITGSWMQDVLAAWTAELYEYYYGIPSSVEYKSVRAGARMTLILWLRRRLAIRRANRVMLVASGWAGA